MTYTMKTKLFITLLLLGFIHSSCSGKEQAEPTLPPIGPEQVFRTPVYLQNPSAEGITLMWITGVPCRSWIEYGTDPDDLRPVRSYDEGIMQANDRIHKIRLDGLRPGTKYYYRACSQPITLYSSYKKEFGDTLRMPPSSFTAWDDAPQDFTVLVFNDIHKKTEVFRQLMDRVGGERCDLVIFNGDCFDDPETEADIVPVLASYCQIYGSHTTPSVFMRGNHETRGAFSLRLWDYISKAGEHSYTAFTLGGTRFVLLDCGEDKPDDTDVYYGMNDFDKYRKDQAEFLKEETARHEFVTAQRRVLIHHIPIYGKAVEKFNPCLKLWQPYLTGTGFDLSLNGHLHRYEFIAEGASGNDFPVVIGGGYKPENATVMVLKKQGDRFNLRVVHVNGGTLLDLDF